MGDFNIYLIKYSTHVKTNELVYQLCANGLVPMIHKPTRIDKSSATLIDHIYTNMVDLPYTSGVITSEVADHFGIFFSVSNRPIRHSPTVVHKRILLI